MIINCKICNNPARLIYRGFPGYIEGSAFDIAQCDVCDAAFSTESGDLGFIYESIYAHAPKLPGYSRYAFYAEQVLREKDPLSFLAESEECYWAVRQLVQNWVQKTRRTPEILEIGCGYGYTTYALRKSGYVATGIDISSKAVQQARDRYGDFFKCCDLLEMVKTDTGVCDIIVMTELIEHIEDPLGFVTQAAKLLRCGGIIIVTTPNKAEATKNAIWQVDLPPVHLWWFSETSMIQIGRHAELRYEPTDFSEYYQKYRKLCRSKQDTFTAPITALPSSVLSTNGTPQKVVVTTTGLRMRRRAEWVFRYLGISSWMRAAEWKLRGWEKYRRYGKSGAYLCGFYCKS